MGRRLVARLPRRQRVCRECSGTRSSWAGSLRRGPWLGCPARHWPGRGRAAARRSRRRWAKYRPVDGSWCGGSLLASNPDLGPRFVRSAVVRGGGAVVGRLVTGRSGPGPAHPWPDRLGSTSRANGAACVGGHRRRADNPDSLSLPCPGSQLGTGPTADPVHHHRVDTTGGRLCSVHRVDDAWCGQCPCEEMQ